MTLFVSSTSLVAPEYSSSSVTCVPGPQPRHEASRRRTPRNARHTHVQRVDHVVRASLAAGARAATAARLGACWHERDRTDQRAAAVRGPAPPGRTHELGKDVVDVHAAGEVVRPAAHLPVNARLAKLSTSTVAHRNRTPEREASARAVQRGGMEARVVAKRAAHLVVQPPLLVVLEHVVRLLDLAKLQCACDGSVTRGGRARRRAAAAAPSPCPRRRRDRDGASAPAGGRPS